jgi:hypothetical protein
LKILQKTQSHCADLRTRHMQKVIRCVQHCSGMLQRAKSRKHALDWVRWHRIA